MWGLFVVSCQRCWCQPRGLLFPFLQILPPRPRDAACELTQGSLVSNSLVSGLIDFVRSHSMLVVLNSWLPPTLAIRKVWRKLKKALPRVFCFGK